MSGMNGTISLEERVYGLSLLWRETEYNFAYWDELPHIDWNARYREYLPQVMAEGDPLRYYALLKRFMAVLRDGHTYVEIPEQLKPPYRYHFGTTYGEGKHLLWGRPKSSGLPFYSRITSVNGIPVEEYAEKYIYPYIWHENLEAQFAYSMLGYVIGCREKGRVQIETENGSLSLQEEDREDEEYPVLLTHPSVKEAKRICETDDFTVRILRSKIAYIRTDTFADEKSAEELQRAVEKCGDCVGFIIDVRNNRGGSGNNARMLAEAFFEETIPDPPSRSPANIAEFRAYGQYRDLSGLNLDDPWEKRIHDVCSHRLYLAEEEKVPEKKGASTLRQPVAVLAGPHTASAAETFLAMMKYKKRCVLMGQNSMGTNGQPLMGKLPGGGAFGICTQKCFLYDGTSFNNVGIAPDIYVENTIEDRRNGFDRIIDNAIAYLSSRTQNNGFGTAAG